MHRRWLAMEVEGALQIRNAQYILANHLIKNAGSISQLNMGLGKTRVVLPMLVLHYTEKSRRSDLVRVNVLSSLLDECFDYFQRFLMSSQSVMIYKFPFNRSLELTSSDLKIALVTLKECKSKGGVLLITPESHSSLMLKSKEAFKKNLPDGPLYKELLKLLAGISIFDESDALLHYRYQLIYSVGISSPLEHGSIRWNACQAILHVLNSMDIGSSLASIGKHVPGEYRPVFLKRDRSKEDFSSFLKEIASNIVHSPPEGLEWMAVIPVDKRVDIIDFICNPSKPADEYFKEFKWNDQIYYFQLLAIRGIIGFGLLENGLLKNHREE